MIQVYHLPVSRWSPYETSAGFPAPTPPDLVLTHSDRQHSEVHPENDLHTRNWGRLSDDAGRWAAVDAQ